MSRGVLRVEVCLIIEASTTSGGSRRDPVFPASPNGLPRVRAVKQHVRTGHWKIRVQMSCCYMIRIEEAGIAISVDKHLKPKLGRDDPPYEIATIHFPSDVSANKLSYL
jgi:hypothetical protein